MERKHFLKTLIDERFDGNQAEFSRAIKKAPAQVHQWLIGNRNISSDMARYIERTVGLPFGWLDGESVSAPNEDVLNRESLSQAAMAFGDKLFDPEPGYIAFDLLNVRAAAGNGYSAVEFPEVVNKLHVLESWAKLNLPVDLANIKVITARGTSMQGTIENGDVLFVDSSVRSYDGDGIYVIARGADIQVKRLQRLNGDVLVVISDNRAYESERLVGDDADSVVICGRVLAAWTIKRFW